jgi:TonB family protein
MFWNDEQKLAITKQFKNDSLHGYYRRFTDQGKLAKETLYNFGQSVKDTVFISEKEDSSAYKDGFKSIMSMAIFPGCESVENSKSREQCTEIAIQDYIKENTRYPENVRDAGYTGRIVMSFIIDGDGEVSKLKIIESVEFGKELEDEAIRVIMSLPKMIPASSYGESCRIQYTVPVNFKLQGGGIPLKVIGEKIKEEKELKQFEIVEDMPVWPTCTTEISRLEKEQCTNLEIMKFVANSAKEKYPKDLKKGKIGGRAYCRFVINEVGNVEDVMIIRPTGNAILDSISREVIRSFPLLAPATQDGKPVKVQYTVPVNFR